MKRPKLDSTVSSRNEHLLESSNFSDVTFLVGKNLKQRILAHKLILMSASSVFDKIFHEHLDHSMNEGQCLCEIKVPDVSPSIFRLTLKWIYTDKITLGPKKVLPLLYCADKYELTTLKEKCISMMKKVPFQNLCSLYYKAKCHGIIHLVPWIKYAIVINPYIALSFDSILGIKDSEVLNDILSSDFLDMDEIDIFKTALHWAINRSNKNKNDLREILGSSFHAIRFPLLSPAQMVKEVIHLKLLKDEETLDILKFIFKSESRISTRFSIQPRVRTCARYKLESIKPLTNLTQSFLFVVNEIIKIHGFGIYQPCKKGSKVTGSIRLESFYQIQEEAEKVSASKIFELEYDINHQIGRLHFDSPITINSNSVYKVYLEYEKSSLNVKCHCGMDGSKNISVDGVMFGFKDCPQIPYESDLNVLKDEGIPFVIFSRIL